MAERAFLALGSNLGDRTAYLDSARRAIADLDRTTVIAESTVEETAPLGPPDQGPYLNQMLLVRTDLDPRDLLAASRRIEDDAGRTRGERWGPRTLDVDLVDVGDRVVADDDLILPHPEILHRPFWLRELAELLPATGEEALPEWAVVKTKRRAHIDRVVGLIGAWAIAMRRPPDERRRWMRAAYLHDALRDADPTDLARWAAERWQTPALYHGPAAAAVAEEHGETDRGVLDAVRYHTVGYAGWDDVGRMLYMADYLEPGRRFRRGERAELAARVAVAPDDVLRAVAGERLAWTARDGNPLHPEFVSFWNALASSA